MKKIICLGITLILIFSLVGCGGNNVSSKSTGNTGGNTVQDVLSQQIKDPTASIPGNSFTETQPPKSSAPIDNSKAPEKAEITKAEQADCDVDLTKLSSTMVYSEVYNMMTEPEKYIGKSVRTSGQFALYWATNENGIPIPNQFYFACIIADATSCCSQGLEFVLAGEHVYPDDYPEEGDEITVSGIFETYDEDGYLYCHLVDAVLEQG